MTEYVAETIYELRLYPYRSKAENVIRGSIWIISWIIGIVLQRSENQSAIGGSYLIFSLSLLLEFVPESKNNTVARGVHGGFCTILFTMFMASVFVSFIHMPAGEESLANLFDFFAGYLPIAGWIVMIILATGTILVFFESPQNSISAKKELEQDTTRKKFMENLNDHSKGDN